MSQALALKANPPRKRKMASPLIRTRTAVRRRMSKVFIVSCFEQSTGKFLDALVLSHTREIHFKNRRLSFRDICYPLRTLVLPFLFLRDRARAGAQCRSGLCCERFRR